MVLTTFLVFNGALEWDEGSFLQNSEFLVGEGQNFEESRPAAISYAITLIWQITGESTFAARALIVLFGIATVMLFHRIASEEFEEPLLATSVFGLSPLMIYWSSKVYTDVPALLLVLAGLYAYRKKNYLASGVLMSLASTIRYLFFVFAVGMGFAYLIEHREKIVNYIAGGYLGALPFMIYSIIEYGNPFSKVIMYLTRVSKWSSSGLFAATISSTLSGVYMLSALIPAAYTGWDETPLIEKSMLLTYTLFMLLISGNSFQRYWLAVLPIMILIAYRGLNRDKFMVVSVVMILISAHGVGANYQMQQECSKPLDQALDFVSDYEEGGVVTDSWAVGGYKLDREVYSPWTDYDTLRRDHGVNYAVTSEKKEYELMKSFSNSCITYYVYDLSNSPS